MQNLTSKTKLVFLPLLAQALLFIIIYCFLYWLLWIKLDIIPLRHDIVHLWVPMALSFLVILLFTRPRIHLLKLDKDNGRLRGLYYMAGTAILFVPCMIFMSYLDSATGKLTTLDLVSQIKTKPVTKYYKPNTFILNKVFTGVEATSTYSGKHNQYLNWNLYITVPFTDHLFDTLQSPSAFLLIKYRQQLSSKISEQLRKDKWKEFWNSSFEKFEKDPIRFQYLERLANTEDRQNALLSAEKSRLYKKGSPAVILEPINEPFELRNGHKLRNASLSLGIGLFVWFILILIPGLHENKAKKFRAKKESYVQEEISRALVLLKPQKGFTVTPLLIMCNCFIFLLMVIKGLGFDKFYSRELLAWGALFQPLVEQGEWWRLFASMFLHGGIWHLFMNMFSLYIGGIFLEQAVGFKSFLFTYLLSGAIAGFSSMWWQATPTVAVGASGAIFGLFGMLLALTAFKFFEDSLKRTILVLLACTAGFGLLMGFVTEGIDNAAHIGGLLAGFCSGMFYMRLKRPLRAE